MARLDRLMRRLASELAVDEGIVASCLGIEADGRRRRIVVLTDRRLFVAWARGGEHTTLVRSRASCSYTAEGGRLTLRDGDEEVALRGVPGMAGRTMAQLLPSARLDGGSLQRVLRVVEHG